MLGKCVVCVYKNTEKDCYPCSKCLIEKLPLRPPTCIDCGHYPCKKNQKRIRPCKKHTELSRYGVSIWALL